MQPDAPVRILYPMAGDTVGGSHLSTIDIIRGLDPVKFQAHVVLHHAGGPLAGILRKKGLSFEDAGMIVCPPSFPRVLKDIIVAKKFLHDCAIDIVHCDDGPLRYLWLYAARLAGCKYVHVQRTLPRLNPEKRFSFGLADAVVANSHTTRRALPRLLATVRQAVAFPPVEPRYGAHDREKNRASIAAIMGVSPKRLVSFVANLHPRKRPDVFVAMAAHLREQGMTDVHFAMVGGAYGDTGARLREQVSRFGLQDCFYFAGFQDDPQAWIGASDVLAASAENEAFGRTLVEAMLLHTPVAASASGGHMEIISDGETGFLTPPGDPAALAARVRELLENPALAKKMCSKAHDFAVNKFPKDHSLNVFYKIYEDISKQTRKNR